MERPICTNCVKGFKGCALGRQIIKAYISKIKFTFNCSDHQKYIPTKDGKRHECVLLEQVPERGCKMEGLCCE